MFKSLRFNIGLLCALILASAAGTLLPQAPEDLAAVEAFLVGHPGLGKVLSGLGFFDLFHSPWFLGLWAVIVLDIVLCRLIRLPVREPDGRPEDLETAAAGQPLAVKFTAQDASKAFSGITTLLRDDGYAVRRIPTGTAPLAASAEAHPLQAWGSYVSHAAMIVLLAGCLVKAFFGFNESVLAAEDGSVPVTKRPGWAVHVAAFTVERYENGSPKRFATRLAVYEHGRLVVEDEIRVNAPLSVRGLVFYQESWGVTGMWRTASLAWPDRELQLTGEVPRTDPVSGSRFSAELFASDFGITPDGRADNLTTDLRNPALRVSEQPASAKPRTWWLFRDAPGTAYLELPDGTLKEAPPPPFRLASVDPVLFSGLQVVHDPGYPLVLAGSLAWLAGMVLNFHLHRRRILVVAAPAEPGHPARVSVGGWSSRGAGAFKDDFNRLVARMREVSS
ncbi:MAG: cytochrome c biogenesis protein ResB [Elusimicrobiota bacterium]|jgi:cytochrome c biogenesis protein